MNMLNERLTLEAAGLALATAILWGGNSVSIKFALAGMPPLALAGARFILGGLVVFLWAALSHIPLRLHPAERTGLLHLALLFIAQIALLNVGTYYTLAGRATIFISTYPFFTALSAHFCLPGDRLTWLKAVGIVLSFAGVVLVFGESLVLGRFTHIPGDLMVLFSGLLLGIRQVYTKRLTQGIPPSKVLLWQALLSVPVFLVASAILESDGPYRLSAPIVGAILYQGLVVAGFCFLVSISLLRRHQASRLGVFGFVSPVFGVLLSNLILGEAVSPALLASMVLVGAGIAIVNYEA